MKSARPSPEKERDRRRKLEDLFVQHGPTVYGFARRRASTAEAEEVVSDTFLVAWRRLDAVPADPLPWLLNVARNSLANHRRGEGRRQALRQRLSAVEPPAHDDTPTSVADDAAMSERVTRALAALPAAERDALTLVVWEELTPDEVATVLGCSRAAVYLRLSRARRRLRRALGDDPDLEGTRDDD